MKWLLSPLVLLGAPFAQSADAPFLIIGQLVSRRIKAGEVHWYRVEGRTGEMIRGSLRQDEVASVPVGSTRRPVCAERGCATLIIGQLVSRRIKAGEVHWYRVEGRTGEMIRASLRQDEAAVCSRLLPRRAGKYGHLTGRPNA